MADKYFKDKLKDLVDRIKDLEHKIHPKPAPAPTPAPAPAPAPAPIYLKVPTKEMTGVSPFMTQLCATISSDLYAGNTKEDFTDLTVGYSLADVGLTEETSPKVILYSNNGIFEVTNPPFSIVVCDKTMIIGWRGSYTIMDWVRDFGFFISSSFRWFHVGKVVKVQGAYLSMIDNFMVDNESFILDTIKKDGITDLIFTGHSLAGGVAQVGHLWCEGSMNQQDSTTSSSSPWKELNGKLTIRTVAFEAPMTTVYIKSDDDEDLNARGIAFIQKCGSTMSTTCYKTDAVPRMYGHPDFALDIIESVITEFEKNPDIPFLLKPEWDIAIYAMNKLINKEKGPGESIIAPYLKVARSFQHIGNIIYYDNVDSDPQVYVDDIPDNGLTLAVGQVSASASTPTPLQFRTLVYTPPTEKDKDNAADSIEDAYYNHMFIVCGPGLSLSMSSFDKEHLYLL